jgi:hypothetical protein
MSSRDRYPLSSHSHLTPSDRYLLNLLEDHRVLTSHQIQRVLFAHRRTCGLRLEILRGLDLIDQFRFARPYGGSEPWKWVLGLAGARFQAAAGNRPAPTERAHREQTLRLTASPVLTHLLTTNEFFVRLHHAARTNAHSTSDTANTLGADSETVLRRWWPEKVATTRFPGIAPDGHGLWACQGRTVGMFLECDRGTENLSRLTAKLPGYARLVENGGPRYPVLFWLPSPQREANLQRLLRADPPPVPVATATHDTDPAAAVWMPIGGWQRLPLHDLPSDHGPHTAGNPNWRDGLLDLNDQRASRP